MSITLRFKIMEEVPLCNRKSNKLRAQASNLKMEAVQPVIRSKLGPLWHRSSPRWFLFHIITTPKKRLKRNKSTLITMIQTRCLSAPKALLVLGFVMEIFKIALTVYWSTIKVSTILSFKGKVWISGWFLRDTLLVKTKLRKIPLMLGQWYQILRGIIQKRR